MLNGSHVIQVSHIRTFFPSFTISKIKLQHFWPQISRPLFILYVCHSWSIDIAQMILFMLYFSPHLGSLLLLFESQTVRTVICIIHYHKNCINTQMCQRKSIHNSRASSQICALVWKLEKSLVTDLEKFLLLYVCNSNFHASDKSSLFSWWLFSTRFSVICVFGIYIRAKAMV